MIRKMQVSKLVAPAVFFLGTCFGGGALAQAEGDRSTIVIAPRVAYFYDDFSTSGFVLIKQPNGTVDEAVEFPEAPLQAAMYGLTASLRPASMPKATFTFGFLTGKDEGVDLPGSIVNSRFGLPANVAVGSNTFFSRQNTIMDYTRSDLELTGQYRLNDLVALVFGLRYEQGRTDLDACFQSYDSASGRANLSFEEADEVCKDINQLKSANYGSDLSLDQISAAVGKTVGASVTGARRAQRTNIFWQNTGAFEDGYNTTTGRIGFSFAVPLVEGSGHRVFAAGYGVVGHRDVIGDNQRRFDEAWVLGPDLTIGYAYSFSEHLSFDARYRAQYLFPVTGEREADNPRASHGLMLSIGYRL
jgi:hypothetical protein